MNNTMNDFDPYYQWLGIPPAEQPANHYRLLGISTFEHDSTVIENAADQRTLHIRSVAVGPHGQAAQRLLTEISTAKISLLSADRKAAYDQSLRQPAPVSVAPTAMPQRAVGEMPVRPPTAAPAGQRPMQAAPVAQNPAPVATAMPAIAAAPATNASSPTPDYSHDASIRARKTKRKNSSKSLYWIGGGAIVLLLGSFFVLRGIGGQKDDPDNKPTASIELKPISDQTVKVGKQLVINAAVRTQGKVGKDITYAFDGGSPASATIDKKTGKIRWTPKLADAGRSHSFRIRVDAGKLSANMRFPVRVPRVNTPPKIGRINDREAQVGTLVNLIVRASDGRNGGPLAYRLASDLPGAFVHPGTGEFRWQPAPEHGGRRYTVKVAVKDDEGAESFQTFDIRVADYVAKSETVVFAKTIDTTRDQVSGTWKLLGDVLTVAKSPAARLVLTQVPAWSEYVLASHISANPSGRALVAGLLANDRQFLAVLGGSQETTGLRAKDGTLVGSLAMNNGPPVAADGRTDVRYFVHKDGVLVTCNGEPVIDWRGDWSDLADPGPKWQVRPNNDRLFVGADNSESRWEALRLEQVDKKHLASTLTKSTAIRRRQQQSKMPDQRQIDNARALAEKAYGQRIRTQRTLPQLTATYKKINEVRTSSSSSRADRFVLTEMAIDVAILAGKPKTAIKLIDELASDFGTNRYPRYVAAIAGLSKSRHIADTESQQALAEVGASLLERLMRDEQFVSAHEIALATLQAARKAKHAAITERVVQQKNDIMTLDKMHQRVVEARKQLESEPENAQANSIVGRWEAFVRGRWPSGLQQLAKGDNATLQKIAARDLAEPSETDAQFQLAVDWFNLGQRTEGWVQREISARAAYWYAIAAPKMSALQREAAPEGLKNFKVDQSDY